MRDLLLSLILFATCISANASFDDGSNLLSSLQSELHKVRTTNSDKPVQIHNLPDVSSLVGMKVNELSIWLGESDSSSEQSVIYYFYYLPITYVGGGPMLIITFDHNDTITKAQWMGSQ